MSGKEGRRDSNPNRRGNDTELPESATASLLAARRLASRKVALSHALAGIRSPWGVIMISLAYSEVRGSLGLGPWASSTTDSTQLAQRAAELHTVTTPRRTSRLPCSGWCGRVGVCRMGSWALGSRVRAVVEYPSEPWRTSWSAPTVKHDESSPGILRGLKPKQRSSRGLRKPMCTSPAG
jgi:hypothetical protein